MITNYKELESLIRLSISTGKKRVEIELDEKWFFFLIRLIFFYINGKKLECDNKNIKYFRVTINEVKCKVTLKK